MAYYLLLILVTLSLLVTLNGSALETIAYNDSSNHATLQKRAYLPNGPIFVGFPDLNYHNAAATGVLDMWRLAFQALQATRSNPPSSSYNRYFQPHSLCDVRMVFEAVLGQPGGVGPAMMADKLTIIYQRSNWPDIDDNCALDPDERSYFVQQGDFAQIVICERAFRNPRLSLDQTDCNMIGPSASADTMDVIGSYILHEMIHWRALIDQKIGYHIGDWGLDDIEGDDHNPPDGYDAYNAWQLNIRGKPSEQNADNYAIFAAESYYAVRCSLNGFTDPQPEHAA